MKKFLIFLAGAVLGGIAGLLVASGVFTGIGAGAGIITGLKAGACLAVEGAKAEGFINDQQVDAVLRTAGRQISSQYGNDTGLVNGAECQKVVAEIKAEAAKLKK